MEYKQPDTKSEHSNDDSDTDTDAANVNGIEMSRAEKTLKKKKRPPKTLSLFDEILTTSPHWLAGATRATTILNFFFFFSGFYKKNKE